jgi:hypothetical protein
VAAQDDMTRMGKSPYVHLPDLYAELPLHLKTRFQPLGIDKPHTVFQHEGVAIDTDAGPGLGLEEFRERWLRKHLFGASAEGCMPFVIASPNGETMAFCQVAPGRILAYDSHHRHMATLDEAGVLRTLLRTYGLVADEEETDDAALDEVLATCDVEFSFFAGML